MEAHAASRFRPRWLSPVSFLVQALLSVPLNKENAAADRAAGKTDQPLAPCRDSKPKLLNSFPPRASRFEPHKRGQADDGDRHLGACRAQRGVSA